ncbi:hypothetical protein Nepgr_018531 [Nepenthes gracilis]|uniref:NAD-dependent epimerase/dehydratase domain-containing protein n=1 Tax=Nepenthes gracilis TaxID=150966 RepID=A0AAD3STH2_NEPGR|nr:hypothetical protein Nepgr_018531 [Nepenthes gracilis]
MQACYITGQLPATPVQFQLPARIPIISRIKRSMFCARAESSINLGPELDVSTLDCSNRMFILGMGYVGQFFAKDLLRQGWVVSGTCTNSIKKKELEQKGFNIHLLDAYNLEWKITQILKHYTHLLVCIPPVVGIGDLMLQQEEFLKSRLVDGNLQWLCYLSSTSVYGDCKGAWVNEDYPPNPSGKLAELRLDAEEGWLRLGADLGISAHVFRLGGIYGPGRSAIDTILKQEPLSEGQKRRTSKNYTSRVHIADICQALKASIFMPTSRKIYNIVDDDPASREEVFEFAQQLIQKRWDALTERTDLSNGADVPEAERIPVGEKRVSNALMKEELGVRLLHPTYRSGLQTILDHMNGHPFCYAI